MPQARLERVLVRWPERPPASRYAHRNRALRDAYSPSPPRERRGAVREGSTPPSVRMASSDRALSIWLYERVCRNSADRQALVERSAEPHGIRHGVAVRFCPPGFKPAPTLGF